MLDLFVLDYFFLFFFFHILNQDHKLLLPRVDDIGRGIVAAAKEIIIKQQDGRAFAEENEVKKTAFENRVEDKFQVLENKMESLEDKLDMILRKLTTNGN